MYLYDRSLMGFESSQTEHDGKFRALNSRSDTICAGIVPRRFKVGCRDVFNDDESAFSMALWRRAVGIVRVF